LLLPVYVETETDPISETWLHSEYQKLHETHTTTHPKWVNQ
jgi:hypothetical protein